MSRGKYKFFLSGSKLLFPAVVAGVTVTLTTMNACSSDHSVTSREEVMTQNAADAEAAEAEMASSPDDAKHGDKEHAKETAKSHGKEHGADHAVAKSEAGKKGEKAHKAEKAEKHEAAAHDSKDKSAAHKAGVAEHNTVAEHKTVAKTDRHPAAAGGVFVVQVGAFKVKENAEKLHAKLKEAGYNVEMQSIEHSKNGLLHLVRLQPVSDRTQAETAAEEIHAKQDLQAQVLVVRGHE